MAGSVPAIHIFAYVKGSKAWMPGTRPGMTETDSGRFALVEIGIEDRHLEGERFAVILEKQNGDELVANKNLGGILFLRPRQHLDVGVAEQRAQIRRRFLQVGFGDANLKIVGA